ncbi:hypothetical protein EsDP_00005543 [Epichloe bromicola]|uniref:Glutamate decarboxylase n=1 Tax=Epichloe bromicola TaxID=79588 RepID=A0ABQ0CV12_9HYPO
MTGNHLARRRCTTATSCALVSERGHSKSVLPNAELFDEPMPVGTAYHLLREELIRDANPRFNLATFASTWMEPEATRLINESLAKNLVDPRAYPATTQIEQRCLNILASMYNLPRETNEDVIGVSTVGSSEAIMLAVLAMKERWAEQSTESGQNKTVRPNIIMSSAVHICWTKAARYFEVDIQHVPCSKSRYILDPGQAVDLVNEGTIGICCILGTTYTGEYEDVQAVNSLLSQRSLEVPIHVDAASGGFVAPFMTPNLEWDFRLENVTSINVSGHKYGLVYPGIGWGLWRSRAHLPRHLVFQLSYLGAIQESYTLNFTRGSSHVIAQYYQFVRLGKAGYHERLSAIVQVAERLTQALRELGFMILSKADGVRGIPIVAFRLKPSRKPKFDEFVLSEKLQRLGWLVPAYHMADGASGIKLLRVVCRVDFTQELCDLFVRHMRTTLEECIA